MSVLAGLLSLAALVSAHGGISRAQETPLINWAPPFEPPVNLINLYRQPNSDYSAGHRGIDYQVTLGQSVLAPADGGAPVVVLVGQLHRGSFEAVRYARSIARELVAVHVDLGLGKAEAFRE